MFGCLLVALAASSARSQMLPTPTICKTYFASEKGVPSEVAQALAYFEVRGWGRTGELSKGRSILPPIALEKCQNADVFRSYHLLLPPKVRDGVCYFADFDISSLFPKSGGFAPDSGKPDALEKHLFRMMLASGACKSQKDAGYIFTRGITPGVFRKIVDFWREATSSQAALQKAMAVHPNDEFEAKVLARFLAMVRAHIGHLPRIRSVRISAGEFPPLEEPYCLIGFGDPASSNQGWEIDLDFTSDGLKIFRVRNWIA